ncbi:MAG TPA: hypothetical protein VLT33_05290, partial [Labilithrix sp.]|nr:hypothetical protein [Labilithrix sp.]
MRGRLFVGSIVIGLALGALPRDARADERPSAADADAREKSRVAFRKGVAQLRAQDWSAARASFETAWSLYPHPSILLNLAIARLHTDDPARAEQDLVRFLSEDGGASADELASAREALADARSRLGSLRVIVSPAVARVVVDGTAVETVRRADAGASGVVAEMRIKPGRHAISVEADGHVPDRRSVEVVAKAEASVTIHLVAVEIAPRPVPAPVGISTRAVVGWSLVGLAGAALITGGVTALRAKSLSSDYADPASPRFQDPDARSTGITFRTAADVALGVALVSGAAALLLLVTDLGKDSPTPTSATWRT